MFLEIDNQIINLNAVTVIRLIRSAQGIWSVQIEAEKGNILFNKDFSSEEEANVYADKFSELLKPTKFV
jgi:hypothetical protein